MKTTAVQLISTASRGRGLAAVEALESGAAIFAESPLCAHAAMTTVPTADWKRRRRGRKGSKLPPSRHQACCPHCFRRHCEGTCLPDTPTTQRYFEALRSPALAALAALSDRDGARFGLMAAKAALRCVYCDGEREDVVAGEATLKTLEFLACPTQALGSRMGTDSDYPEDWQDLHRTACTTALLPLLPFLRSDVTSVAASTASAATAVSWTRRQREVAAEVTSLRWFAATLGRLHLNAMRTTPDTNSRSDGDGYDYRGGGSIGGGGGVSVLYGLSSLFNHSCNPNTAPMFDGGTVEWRATRRVEAGEELLISYTDGRGDGSHDPTQSDDEWLEWNYGFRCSDSCPYCGGSAPPPRCPS